MTVVITRREARPIQSRIATAARRASLSAISSPRLARGRSEKLVQSRSPSPRGDSQLNLEMESMSPEESMDSPNLDHSTSPSSSMAAQAINSLYRPMSTPSMSETSWTSPRSSALTWEKRVETEFRYSDVEDDEEHEEENTTMTDDIDFDGPSRAYPLRTIPRTSESDIRQSAGSIFQATAFDNKASRPHEKRPLKIAPRPAGQPHLFENAANSGEIHGKKKGIRGPYSTQERRNEVKAVRAEGACMRCNIFRTGCQVLREGESCNACLKDRRKWHIPCTQMWLKDRWIYLLPETFFDQLQLRNEVAFPRYDKENRSHSFDLTIARDYGLRLKIRVFAIVNLDLDNTMFQKFIFDDGQSVPYALPSLPLMAEHSSEAIAHIESTINHHMRALSRAPDQNNLANILFCEDDKPTDEPWVKEVFRMVCGFQENVKQGESEAIEFGLKSIFIRFLISHTFWIPPEEIPHMNKQLPQRWKLPDLAYAALVNDQYKTCPKFVDRYVKARLFDIFKGTLLPKLFREVENLFHLTDKDHGKSKLTELHRDEAFCAIIVVLLLAGRCQVQLLLSVPSRVEANWNGVRDKPNGPEDLEKEAIRCIYEIEREVISHCLHLWSYQFNKERMVGQIRQEDARAAQMSAIINPIATFQDKKASHGESLERINPILDVENTHPDTFVKQNLTRILLRLDEKIWRPKPRRK